MAQYVYPLNEDVLSDHEYNKQMYLNKIKNALLMNIHRTGNVANIIDMYVNNISDIEVQQICELYGISYSRPFARTHLHIIGMVNCDILSKYNKNKR